MRFGIPLTRGHVVVDQDTHGIVPGGNLLVSVFPFFVPFLDQLVLVFERQVFILRTTRRPATAIEFLLGTTFATATTFRFAAAWLSAARFASSLSRFLAIAPASTTSATAAAASCFTLLRFAFALPLAGFGIQFRVEFGFEFLERLEFSFLGECRLFARLAARASRRGGFLTALATAASSASAATPTTRLILFLGLGEFFTGRLFDFLAERHGRLFLVDLVIERA
jgi:hypothetical protein